MSSFSVISKKNRLKIGIIIVIIIHIGMFYGFWRVHARQSGNAVYEMDIYAAKAAEGLAFYEAVATEDCVNVKNEQAPKPGMPVVVEPAPKAAGAKTDKAATKPPAEVKLEPSLFYASSPKCRGPVGVPAGADRLGTDGFVGLELNIDKAGLVQRGEIHRSSGFEDLDAAALKQVTENLTFKPCQKGAVIVGCKQYIKFRWKAN